MQDYAIRIYEPGRGQCYVEFLFETLLEEGYARLPGIEVAKATFKTLGHQPEEMIRAFGRFLQGEVPHLTPDEHFPHIALGGQTLAFFDHIIADTLGAPAYSKLTYYSAYPSCLNQAEMSDREMLSKA